ncbi:M14 family metallopeptidase [Pseudobdellovibrio sp. HCB154]|uniref:M14 family metallopeptidase n=1 Tax=Pseudobdellovibrio sp. HCB154 TaxID=3386277 RepID=UPI003916DC18
MSVRFNLKKSALLATVILIAVSIAQFAQSTSNNRYWMKIRAKDKFERSVIANIVGIENTTEDYVVAFGGDTELKQIQKLGWLMSYSNLADEAMFSGKDFPTKDSAFHNYAEMTAELTKLANENPTLVTMGSIGKSTEGRDTWVLRLGADQSHASEKPAVIYMGGHHAREHLSMEMPLMLAQHLVAQYKAGNERIVGLMNNRDIHIIPMVNPDGAEYDIQDGSYKMWRKNRSRNANGTFGTDLNRNYSYKWGTGGSSTNPNSDTYMGTKPFSEPETINIKNYVEAHTNITTLLSFHTYSQLILYPWGHKYDGLENTKDAQVFETMAKKMAEWNKYTPQQASDLYIASGDTTDWAYGEHKIFAFTFELDPSQSSGGFGGGGFYPGAGVIQPVFNKNIEPALYLMEYADNPYRTINVSIGPIGPIPNP